MLATKGSKGLGAVKADQQIPEVLKTPNLILGPGKVGEQLLRHLRVGSRSEKGLVSTPSGSFSYQC